MQATSSQPMKSVRKSAFDRFFSKRRKPRTPVAEQKENAAERKEALVLLAIVFLFLANVVLYLCHHYGLTSLNDWRPHFEQASARVIL